MLPIHPNHHHLLGIKKVPIGTNIKIGCERWELHPRLPPYEGGELLLLYSAICCHTSKAIIMCGVFVFCRLFIKENYMYI